MSGGGEGLLLYQVLEYMETFLLEGIIYYYARFSRVIYTSDRRAIYCYTSFCREICLVEEKIFCYNSFCSVWKYVS